jgi:hypothetical protein
MGTILSLFSHLVYECDPCLSPVLKRSRSGSMRKSPAACRKITSDGVCLMTECKLIGMYRFYGCQDMETVRAVLQYEQLRGHRPIKQDKEKKPPCCKSCGQQLPPDPEVKFGRPKEYCNNCEPSRSKLRNRKWRKKKQDMKALKP